MAVALEFAGLRELDTWAKAQSMALDGADFGPVLLDCADAIRADALKNFQTHAAPDATAWPALSALSIRTRRKGSAEPLQDRGLLMASVTTRGGQGSFQQITTRSLEIGSNLIYAIVHQEGRTIKPVKGRALAIPYTRQARKFGQPSNWEGAALFRPRGTNILATATQKGRGRGAHTQVETQFILMAAVKIPKREFMGYGPRLEEKINDILGEFVTQYESK